MFRPARTCAMLLSIALRKGARAGQPGVEDRARGLGVLVGVHELNHHLRPGFDAVIAHRLEHDCGINNIKGRLILAHGFPTEVLSRPCVGNFAAVAITAQPGLICAQSFPGMDKHRALRAPIHNMERPGDMRFHGRRPGARTENSVASSPGIGHLRSWSRCGSFVSDTPPQEWEKEHPMKFMIDLAVSVRKTQRRSVAFFTDDARAGRSRPWQRDPTHRALARPCAGARCGHLRIGQRRGHFELGTELKQHPRCRRCRGP